MAPPFPLTRGSDGMWALCFQNNLNHEESDIRLMFTKYGEVRNVRSAGLFTFVRFSHEHEARAALEDTHLQGTLGDKVKPAKNTKPNFNQSPPGSEASALPHNVSVSAQAMPKVLPLSNPAKEEDGEDDWIEQDKSANDKFSRGVDADGRPYPLNIQAEFPQKYAESPQKSPNTRNIQQFPNPGMQPPQRGGMQSQRGGMQSQRGGMQSQRGGMQSQRGGMQSQRGYMQNMQAQRGGFQQPNGYQRQANDFQIEKPSDYNRQQQSRQEPSRGDYPNNPYMGQQQKSDRQKSFEIDQHNRPEMQQQNPNRQQPFQVERPNFQQQQQNYENKRGGQYGGRNFQQQDQFQGNMNQGYPSRGSGNQRGLNKQNDAFYEGQQAERSRSFSGPQQANMPNAECYDEGLDYKPPAFNQKAGQCQPPNPNKFDQNMSGNRSQIQSRNENPSTQQQSWSVPRGGRRNMPQNFNSVPQRGKQQYDTTDMEELTGAFEVQADIDDYDQDFDENTERFELIVLSNYGDTVTVDELWNIFQDDNMCDMHTGVTRSGKPFCYFYIYGNEEKIGAFLGMNGSPIFGGKLRVDLGKGLIAAGLDVERSPRRPAMPSRRN